jgi:hypothetical protein
MGTKRNAVLMVDDEQDVTLTVKKVLEESGLFQLDTSNQSENSIIFTILLVFNHKESIPCHISMLTLVDRNIMFSR